MYEYLFSRVSIFIPSLSYIICFCVFFRHISSHISACLFLSPRPSPDRVYTVLLICFSFFCFFPLISTSLSLRSPSIHFVISTYYLSFPHHPYVSRSLFFFIHLSIAISTSHPLFIPSFLHLSLSPHMSLSVYLSLSFCLSLFSLSLLPSLPLSPSLSQFLSQYSFPFSPRLTIHRPPFPPSFAGQVHAEVRLHSPRRRRSRFPLLTRDPRGVDQAHAEVRQHPPDGRHRQRNDRGRSWGLLCAA